MNKNFFEIDLKDEFLPIYTHLQYVRMFKETSMTIDVSPDKRRSMNKKSVSGVSGMSPVI
jgi:hypothetical protein